MGLSHLSFRRDWKNPADFPTVEPDEATVRADLQYHPDAIKDYINGTLIPSHDALTDAKHSHNNKTVLDGITADDVAKWRGTIGAFRVNVTSSNGVYSADKTFAEIKAAYDAGQQPFVVLTGGTFDLVYTLANFDAPTDGSEPKFVDFERYLVGDGILETEMLRIYSYTTDSGSNVVKRIDEFKMPTSLKNPNALTFTGGATGSYDGSEPETVHIPVIPYEVINKNTAARHSHDNKTVLDGITAEKVTEWDGKNSITDSGGYFTSDTVEGALQEIGAEMALYSGVRPTVMFGAQIDTSNNHVQMDDQDAYDRIRTAYENGSTVAIELYYDSSRSDILPLVTVGANYLSFAATTGYYFSPGHDDIAVMSNIMVTLHSDYTSHCYKNIIYEK